MQKQKEKEQLTVECLCNCEAKYIIRGHWGELLVPSVALIIVESRPVAPLCRRERRSAHLAHTAAAEWSCNYLQLSNSLTDI